MHTIDFHTHIFPDKIAKSTIDLLAKNSHSTPYTDGTSYDLTVKMEEADIDICVTLPVLTKPTQFEHITNYASEINREYRDKKRRLISFGGLHPDCEEVEKKIKYLKELGFLGIKIHPDYQRTYINDPKYIKIIECCKDYDLIVVTHSGVDNGFENESVMCPPDLALDMIKKVKYDKIVLAHYGGNRMWQEVFDKLCDTNVYFDTSFTLHQIEKELFLKILNKHGADKILFATDCPWGSLKNDKRTFLSYGLSEEVNNKILYKNALKLLNLTET